jgi:hypothetical protein
MVGRASTRLPELVEFSARNRAPVVTIMERLRRDRDGWINVQPAVDPEDVPAGESGLARVFSARGPTVPLGSWVPGVRPRRADRSPEPVSLGLQHGIGTRALARLREREHPPLEGWRVLTDHPKRGFVLLVPDGEDPDATLAWLVQAAGLLVDFDLPDAWHAGVFHRR